MIDITISNAQISGKHGSWILRWFKTGSMMDPKNPGKRKEIPRPTETYHANMGQVFHRMYVYLQDECMNEIPIKDLLRMEGQYLWADNLDKRFKALAEDVSSQLGIPCKYPSREPLTVKHTVYGDGEHDVDSPVSGL